MKFFYKYLNEIVMRVDKWHMLRNKTKRHFIAMFHDVVKDIGLANKDEFSITEDCLRDFLKTIQGQGYEIVALDNLIENGLDRDKKCAITFDDGFESLYSIVSPIFEECKIPYTVFITTSYLEKKGYLSEKMLKTLSENKLCTIAMHAEEHLMYRYETDEVLRINYAKCRDRIQKITGKEPSYFAFPYGSVYACSKHNCKIAKSMGAKAVFVTRQRMLNDSDLQKGLYIPRLNIPEYYNNKIIKKYRGIEI